jgi:hypothetical protein
MIWSRFLLLKLKLISSLLYLPDKTHAVDKLHDDDHLKDPTIVDIADEFETNGKKRSYKNDLQLCQIGVQLYWNVKSSFSSGICSWQGQDNCSTLTIFMHGLEEVRYTTIILTVHEVLDIYWIGIIQSRRFNQYSNE